MTDSLPTWTPFDPDAPPSLSDEPGRIVAVVGDASTGEAAAPTAVALARAWGRGGRRVVLFDGGVSAPSLHQLLGRTNDEGLTDAVIYGASVGRVARRVEGEPLFFVPAGTVVADPSGVLSHPRWEGMCRGFLQAGATLVIYLPGGEEGLELALDGSTDVVVLAAEGAEPDGLPDAAASKVRAVLGPDPDAVARVAEVEGADAEMADAAAEEAAGVFAAASAVETPPAAAEEAPAPPALDEAPSEPESVELPTLDEEPSEPEPAELPTLDEEPFEPEPAELPALDEEPAWADGEGEAAPDGSAPDESGAVEEGEVEDFDLEEFDAGPLEPMDAASEPGSVASEPPHGDPILESDGEDPLFAEEPLQDPLAPVPVEEEHPPVPTADEILAEAGDAPTEPDRSPERVAAALDRKEKGGRNQTPLLVLLLVLLAGAVAAWWLGYLTIPGLAPPGGSASLDRGAPPLSAAEPTRPVVPVAPPAAYSVAIEAHQDADAAWQRMEEMAAAAPDFVWTVAPVQVDDAVFHRLLVGPAPDEAAAAVLAQEVGDAAGEDASGWLVRPTVLAFLVEEAEGLDVAAAAAAALRDQRVPAYVLAVAFSDGSTRYRVYAGAYADAGEAAYLGALLQDARIPAELTDRLGTPTAATP